MGFKYKSTIIKVIKAKFSSLKADSVVTIVKRKVAGKVSKDFKFNEDNVRKACFDALNSANRKRLKSIAFLPFTPDQDADSLKSIAKIMAQEAFRAIREPDSNLKQITFALPDEAGFKSFGKAVYTYLSYITDKLSNGPFSTVDIIIGISEKIVLIERSNPPFGWALPGGFVDYGESLEQTAIREAKEETGMDIFDLKQFHTYSEPGRDPRFHTISTVFTAKAKGRPKASSDAKGIGVFGFEQIDKMRLAFDHKRIMRDYFESKI